MNTRLIRSSSGRRASTCSDHRVAGDPRRASSSCDHPLRCCRARIRHHKVPNLGRRIPHPYRRVWQTGLHRNRTAPCAVRAPRARSVGIGFVPARRNPQQRPRVATAQGADDHVVAVRACSPRRQHVHLAARKTPSLKSRGGGVLQQPPPGNPARSQARATTRAPFCGPILFW